MNATLEFLKVNAKAVAGFVAGLILSAIQQVINGQVPWPQSLKEWGQYLGTALISGVIVWATGNKLTESQIVKGAVQQGITVVTGSAIDVVADSATAAVKSANEHFLPGALATPVNEVAQKVSDTVTDVLKGVASNFPNRLG